MPANEICNKQQCLLLANAQVCASWALIAAAVLAERERKAVSPTHLGINQKVISTFL